MCTMIGCQHFYSSCEEYDEHPDIYFDWDMDELLVATEFGCKQGCNFCNNCHCDADGGLVPGEVCTQRECWITCAEKQGSN